MKLVLLAVGLLGLLVVFWILQRFRAYAKIFAAPHLKEVADALPGLRRAALEGIDNTEPTVADARALITSAGLVILYTVRRDAESKQVVHHVSVSLGGGRTPHGVGAYFLIFVVKGLGAAVKSASYLISETQLFHAEWLLAEAEHAAFAAAPAPAIAAPGALWAEAVELRRELHFTTARPSLPAR